MKKLVLSAALLAGGLLGLQDLASAHGGQYRGPGDTVPPGGGASGGGGGPGAAGPAGPTAPSPSGPVSPGAGPATPGATGPRTGITGAGAAAGPDLTLWSFWWEFNKEPYLNLKEAIQSGGVTTGSDGWFLGRGEKSQANDSLKPTEEQIRQKVVPALLNALETETNNDIVTGSLIALAKIGDTKSESGESEFEKVIEKWLDNSVQEIAETAAVSLGILANDASVKTLADLLRDNEAGRALVKSNQVNYRTRSYAAYGLALIGARTGSEEVQREVVRHLREVLESDDTSSRDLSVACIISLGMVPLQTIEGPAAAEAGAKKDGPAPPETSRIAQLDYLLAYLQNDDNRFLVRAHCPTALARLLEGLPDELYATYKDKISKDFLERIGKRSKEKNEVVQSCVLALGILGDCDSDKVDADIREALAAVPKDVSDQQARNFSLVSMAKVGGRMGSGEGSEDGVKDASKFLIEQLSKGKSTIQPWAGLAIGVMGRELAEANVSTPVTVAMKEALRSSLDDEKSTLKLPAYAIGVGVMGDQESKEILMEKLQRLSDDEARGYIAVSLGLMGAREATPEISKIVKDSKYRPDLLKQAAIALGLLGDKELVPELIDMLSESKGLATQAAISSALGFIGDQRSIDPLVEMLENKDITATARGFAAVALGIVADKELLPWNSKIAVDLNYRASTQTLNDQTGTGILNIL